MWPDDIKNTINKVGNLPDGGTPFFVHEVIDQGGEPIKVQEYFGVGRTTEFRYGIKVGESVRNKNYAALGGVYDQGESSVQLSQALDKAKAAQSPLKRESCLHLKF